MRKLFPHKSLDVYLDQASLDPDTFESEVMRLVQRLESEDADLEIRDPQEWRRGTVASKESFVLQFRADVEAILPLNRKEEAQLARRIEFARMRFCEGKNAGLEEGRLARRATELHALRSEMVERNLYLVLINVERFSHASGARMDLIQEGCASLFRAVDGFDWRRGLLFRTYAVHWLYQAFRNYLYNNGHTVRVPVYLQKALKGIRQATARLGDPYATTEEIARVSRLEEGLVATAVGAMRSTYSLDADGLGEGSRLGEILLDPYAGDPYQPRIEDVSLETGLGKALTLLGEREQLVLRLRFGIGEPKEHTLSEVARLLGISVERVRQIQVRALDKLATPALRKELEPFLN